MAGSISRTSSECSTLPVATTEISSVVGFIVELVCSPLNPQVSYNPLLNMNPIQLSIP
jgi:hypothetical protein